MNFSFGSKNRRSPAFFFLSSHETRQPVRLAANRYNKGVKFAVGQLGYIAQGINGFIGGLHALIDFDASADFQSSLFG